MMRLHIMMSQKVACFYYVLFGINAVVVRLFCKNAYFQEVSKNPKIQRNRNF